MLADPGEVHGGLEGRRVRRGRGATCATYTHAAERALAADAAARAAGGGVMADTLRSLAGDDASRPSDVISALHAPLTPEELVLDRYVFLPHARTGIAAALDDAVRLGRCRRAATVEMQRAGDRRPRRRSTPR